jgi:galactokinase/mevalonate kinase-like predicted kinase
MLAAMATAPARAALLGNPSDGYGGAVVGFAFQDFQASVSVGATDDAHPDALPLLRAAAVRAGAEGAGLRMRTTIPREVGLGGSSAIVIAALRALGAEGAPDDLARQALAVEVEDLGIAAGLQDRLVQARGGVLLMDFGAGTVEPLDRDLLPPLYVGWREDASEASGVFHSGLRARFDRGEPAVVAAMAELGEVARSGAAALRAGEYERLAALVDRSFDLRAEIADLDDRHVRMIELARGAGASANYAGSGGAIAGTLPHRDAFDDVRRALATDGCWAIRPTLDHPQRGLTP